MTLFPHPPLLFGPLRVAGNCLSLSSSIFHLDVPQSQGFRDCSDLGFFVEGYPDIPALPPFLAFLSTMLTLPIINVSFCAMLVPSALTSLYLSAVLRNELEL